MKGTTVFFLYLQQTDCIAAAAFFGPYKEIIQRVQGALERCLAGDLL